MSERETMILSRYDAVAEASQRMVEAARAADWPALAEAESRCVTLIEEIRSLGGADGLSAAGRRSRMVSLGRVLAHDAEIRRLADPAVARLERLFAGRNPELAP